MNTKLIVLSNKTVNLFNKLEMAGIILQHYSYFCVDIRDEKKPEFVVKHPAILGDNELLALIQLNDCDLDIKETYDNFSFDMFTSTDKLVQISKLGVSKIK